VHPPPQHLRAAAAISDYSHTTAALDTNTGSVRQKIIVRHKKAVDSPWSKRTIIAFRKEVTRMAKKRATKKAAGKKAKKAKKKAKKKARKMY
jgi:hypothetical protein